MDYTLKTKMNFRAMVMCNIKQTKARYNQWIIDRISYRNESYDSNTCTLK